MNTKNENNICLKRQGDMLIWKIKSIPAQAEGKNAPLASEIKNLIVGEGEVTGHKHAVMPTKGGTVKVYNFDSAEVRENYSSDENVYFEVEGAPAIILHDEHAPLVLEVGTYVRVTQIQYNPFMKILERVAD